MVGFRLFCADLSLYTVHQSSSEFNQSSSEFNQSLEFIVALSSFSASLDYVFKYTFIYMLVQTEQVLKCKEAAQVGFIQNISDDFNPSDISKL